MRGKIKMKKVNEVIEIINRMDIKDKLRLAICISQSEWSGLIYNTKENYEKFDTMLKELDEEYRTTLVNFSKYKLVMFIMAKLTEMDTTEQNKIAMYLVNNIQYIHKLFIVSSFFNKNFTYYVKRDIIYEKIRLF